MCSPTALLDRELKRDGFSGVHRDRGEGPMLAESVWLEVERLAGEIPAHHDLGVAATIRAHSHDHKHERSLYRLLGMPADVGSHGGVLAAMAGFWQRASRTGESVTRTRAGKSFLKSIPAR
jgi:hypothetical protein